MSAIEPGLYAALAADGTIAGLVGTRIRPGWLRASDTMPAITYQRISTNFSNRLYGASVLSEVRIQVTSWASTYSGAKTLATAVRAELENTKATWNSKSVQSVTMADEGDIVEESPDLQQRRRFGVRQDYMIWYAE